MTRISVVFALLALACGGSTSTPSAPDGSVSTSGVIDAGVVDAGPPPPGAIVSGQGGPFAIAVANGQIYWANDDGSVLRAATDGGDVTLVTNNEDGIDTLTTDGTTFYWVTGTGDVFATVDGTTISHIGTGVDAAADLLVIGGTLYIADSGSGQVSSVSTHASDASVTTVATLEAPVRLATDGTLLYVSSWGSGPLSIWDAPSSPGDGFIESIDPSTGAETMLAGQLERPCGMALQAGALYFGAGNQGFIGRIDLTGGTVSTIAAGSFPVDVAVVGDQLVWSDIGAPTDFMGSLNVTPLGASQNTTVIAGGQILPFGLTTSGAQLFWVDTGDTSLHDGAVWEANLTE